MTEKEISPAETHIFVGRPDPDGKIAFVQLHLVDIDESAEFLADIVAENPGVTMRPVDDIIEALGLTPSARRSRRGDAGPDENAPKPNREPVLPYLEKIAQEGPPGIWTARQLAERCKALGWKSTSARASSSVVRRMDELKSKSGYVVEKIGGGRSAKWKIAYKPDQ